MDVLDYKEVAEDASIDHDDAALDEEDGIGLVVAGVAEEVGDMQNSLKSSSLLYFMLKSSNLIT